ncbi:MAG TPA: single-stranded-DNA-specific exonuclease RecJ [Solirubrobacteraceae bacterium]|nr:single-stranded-DNA-specific exonuclease RecJ [Solirubrobacteraceae bacterium]
MALVNETQVGDPAPVASALRPVPDPPALEHVAPAPRHDVPRPDAQAKPTPRLVLPPYDLGAALELERELGIGHVLAQVLVRRGLADPGEAQAFLNPSDAHSPLEFDGIEAVLETVGSHLRASSRIVVHGDYDVDGICATAIMVRALRSLGADVGWFLPSRERDGYGLQAATVQRLAARGTGLLITVDCGITAVDEVDAALSAGLDVIVTDHHTPRADGLLPSCGIVHPVVCGYPCPDLCGSGVAWKLAEALGADTAPADLELVALATVADLVPLQGENRRLVRAGIAELAGSAKPGLRALMEVARTDPSALDTQAIGFRLAPRINAAGRMRSPDAGLELLLTDSHERAREIAAELDAVNAERRAVEQRIGWEADAQVAELGERPIYVLDAPDWHHGVIGIVASRVVERYHRPAILIGRGSAGADGTGTPAQGSGRSIPGFDLLAALHAGAGELTRYGGHRAAAGLTIEPDRIPAFRALVEAHAAAVLTEELLVPVERIDAVASGGELGLATAEELGALEPCGIGNPRSRLLVPGARFEDIRTMGEGRHARFSVSSGGARARAVAFGCDGRPAQSTDEPLDASFRLELNVWNGAVEPRLVLGHARPCAPAPIEVLGEPEDYIAAALAEVDGDPAGPGAGAPRAGGEQRTVLDRRGESPLTVLADAGAAGPVLAVCADVPRRLPGLAARTGGFALIAGSALLADPLIAERYEQIVVLDPPAEEALAACCRTGSGFTHMAWSEPELRFAEQIHELEYGLRTSLVSLYRALRPRRRAAGEELEQLLRGDGPHGRSARLAGKSIRVLAELELVSLDRESPAVALVLEPDTANQRTELHRSNAYRTYEKTYEDGRRFLSSARPRAVA